MKFEYTTPDLQCAALDLTNVLNNHTFNILDLLEGILQENIYVYIYPGKTESLYFETF